MEVGFFALAVHRWLEMELTIGSKGYTILGQNTNDFYNTALEWQLEWHSTLHLAYLWSVECYSNSNW